MSRILSGYKLLFATAALVVVALAAPNVVAIAPPAGFNWSLVTPVGAPAFRCFGSSSVYDALGDKLIVFGGNNCAGSTLNDTWVLANASGALGVPTWLPGPPGPMNPRANHSAAYDAANDRMIIFGGCLGGCTPTLNDTWVLVNASGVGGPPAWAPVPAAGPPPGRQGHRAFYDPTSNRMIVFAGQNGGGSTCCGQLSHDTWVLTNANGLGGPAAWMQLAPAGGPPPGAYYPSGSYDPSSNTLTVTMGGDDGGVTRNAVWILSNANGLGGTPSWTNPVPEGAPGSPPPRMSSAYASALANNRLTLFGGAGMTDTWVLTNANGSGAPAWTQLATTGAPSTGAQAPAAYDPTSNKLIMFASNAGNTANEVWHLTNGNGIAPPPPPPPPVTVRAAAKAKFAKTPINIQTKGRTPMTVFGSASFDVTTIVESSVRFGANGTESAVVAGFTQTTAVDKDIYPDRIFYFQKSAAATPCGTTIVKIKGMAGAGGTQAFSGQDSIKIVPCQAPPT